MSREDINANLESVQPPGVQSNPASQPYYATCQQPFSLAGNHTPLSCSATEPAALNTPNLQGLYTPDPASQAAFTQYPAMSKFSSSKEYADLDDAPATSNWLQQEQRSNRRSRWIIGGSVLLLAILVAVGVALGVTLSKKSSSSSNNNVTGLSGNITNYPNGTNPNDPAHFQKNPALQQSFWGMAYTPLGSQYPTCGNSLEEVIEDIQLLSQLTTNIRLYGADCNQSSLVLAAIQMTQVNMSVYLGNYPSATDNGTAYTRQAEEIQTALQQFGSENVVGVTVGNEFVLDYITAAGQTDPNGLAGNEAASILIPMINNTKSILQGMGLTIPVGTAEAGAYFNNEILEQCAYGMSNVHPWFANVSIDQAAAWTYEFFQESNVQPFSALPNKPKMFIAETGWPTNTSIFNYDPNDGPSIASAGNLQIFIDTFACQANANGTEYFFFEFCDEPWKAVQYGGVEGWWGLFYSNKTLKPITIPQCQT